jgi:hypothetical protein
MRAALLVLCLVLATLCATQAAAAGEENLLAGRQPLRESGVQRASVLTDGMRASPGDFWNTDLTAILGGARAFVEYDFGRATPIVAAYLQGDNNDDYVLSVSEDGAKFQTLWRSGPHEGVGLQERHVADLEGHGRYLKIAARGGDGSYALSEVQVFAKKPAVFPPQPRQRSGVDPLLRVRSSLLMFALGSAAFIVLSYAGAPTWWLLVTLLGPLLTGVQLWQAIKAAWPLAGQEVGMLRAVVAALALLVLVREAVAVRWRPNPRVMLATLAACAALSFACFYNLGHPQFWNQAKERPTFVHWRDMRIYFPVAKFFDELRFDGVYLASVAAYLDDTPARADDAANLEIRDLRTHELKRVSELKPEMSAVRGRFSPERWQVFKEDMRYFRSGMGERFFLDTLNDHGGNATPVWFGITHLLFRGVPASELTLTLAGLVDAVLLLAAWIAIFRSFGLRPALFSVIVFGATDLYMFGTNWAGATLRHDWMAYLAFGLCALKTERWVLGGALLALSGLIRAFPAVALLGLVAPSLWWVYGQYRADRRLPSLKTFRAEHPNVERVLLGATLCVVLAVALSSALLSPSAWGDWLAKITMLNEGAGSNDVSLRSLIAGTDAAAGRAMAQRRLLFLASLGLGLSLVALATRGRRLDQAALLGLGFVPLIFNPSNYYLHYVFLLPLLVSAGQTEPRAHAGLPILSVCGPLLGMCVAQYWLSLDPDDVRHFQYATALLFLTLGWIYVRIVQRDFRERAQSNVTTTSLPE